MSHARLGKIAVLTAVTFWALGNLIVRGTELTGPQIAFWRYLIAAIGYAIGYTIFVGPLRWADFRVAAPVGIVLALEIAAFFVAIKDTTIANVTVIGSLAPLLLFVVAARRFDERISIRLVVSTAMALVGVAAVVFGAEGNTEWNPVGDTLAVVALVLFAMYFAFGKIARETISGITLQTHSLLAGLPVLLVVLVVDSGGLPVPGGTQWWYVIGLVALPSTGHFLIGWAHEHVSLTLLSLMTLAVPVISVVGARIVFGETVSATQVAGIATVLVVLAFAIVETTRIEPEVTTDAGWPISSVVGELGRGWRVG
jgi:drug/metabolite transporter (DMT)-like permease